MKIPMRTGIVATLSAVFSVMPLAAPVTELSGAEAQTPMLDPWVPPAIRGGKAAIPSQGAALQEQVDGKLRAHFAAADVKGTGTLTRAQAQAAGLVFIVNHFDRIDQRKVGVVNFDEVIYFLRQRESQLR